MKNKNPFSHLRYLLQLFRINVDYFTFHEPILINDAPKFEALHFSAS
jgi:hypothetical protein